MDHLHIRCPSCAKLYQVDVTKIFSSTPEFQCIECSTRFAFDFPPEDVTAVKTRVVVPQVAQEKTKKCPRCAAETVQSAVECKACGVIFEKLEGLPENRSLKAQPSLVRRWKEVLADYANDELHQEFIMACMNQDALEYARYQYRELKRLQGQDEIAERMLRRIEGLTTVMSNSTAASAEEGTSSSEEKAHFWTVAKQVGLFIPYVVGLVMVLWGVSPQGQKNMIGLGMAILLLSYGILPEARETLKRLLRRI